MINIIIIGIIGHNRQTQQENNTEADILRWCEDNGRTMWEFVEMHETPAIWDHLAEVWKVMQDAIERGIDAEGVLPGRLNLPRKAASFYTKARSFKGTLSRRAFTFAFALAVSEENAAGGKIVTAPTCGSCGVIPAVLYLLKTQYDFNEKKIHGTFSRVNMRSIVLNNECRTLYFAF